MVDNRVFLNMERYLQLRKYCQASLYRKYKQLYLGDDINVVK